MGDFNAKIGQKEDGEENIVGEFGYGERNERGENLITWLWQEGFCVGNTIFKKKEKNQWTWLSPDGRTKNLIDYILINKKSVLMDVSVIPTFKFETDHRLVRAKLVINHKTRRMTNNKSKTVLPSILTVESKNNYKVNLEMQLSSTCKSNHETQMHYNYLEETIKSCADSFLNIQTRRKEEKLKDSTKKLMNDKQTLQKKPNKTPEEKSRLNQMKKQLKASIRNDVKQHDKEVVKEILTTSGSFKKLKNI